MNEEKTPRRGDSPVILGSALPSGAVVIKKTATAALAALGLAFGGIGTHSADFVLPRPTDATATSALVECIDADGCTVAAACTDTPEIPLEDHDFAAPSSLAYGEMHETETLGLSGRSCAVRVAGRANVTGYRYLKHSKATKYKGIAEVPMHRAGALVDVRLADVAVESLPFLVVLVDARVKAGGQPAALDEAASIVRNVLSRMGFEEHIDYRIAIRDATVDVTDVEQSVLEEGSSGPATNRFRKKILEAIDYRTPQTHGVVFAGVVGEWPTGRDHGSYQYAGADVRFASFCTSFGFLTCSVREDCLGHELGHAFGLEHERHGWYGFAPTEDHRIAVRRMTRCAPLQDYAPNGHWDDSLLDLIVE